MFWFIVCWCMFLYNSDKIELGLGYVYDGN